MRRQMHTHMTNFGVAGELVGDFSAFYNPDSGETKEAFTQAINRNV
jgi:ATP-binding cassette subfamily B (MDR/TAP) protein 1